MKATSPSVDGITEFYSSQAEVLLAQYKNIEHLLEPKHDYAGPGMHAEMLLRDFLRRNLPMGIAVDKGFIFGKHEIMGESCHCPEIDILIHDALNYRPVFRLEDFVIVQHEAVLGIIQVKRHLGTDLARSGINNTMKAKRHLVETDRLPDRPTIDAPYAEVFSAVVGFANDPADYKTLKTRLQEAYDDSANEFCTPPYTVGQKRRMMPDFIGTMDGCFCTANELPFNRSTPRTYRAYPSYIDGKNVSLHTLLHSLNWVVGMFTNSHLRGNHLPPYSTGKILKDRHYEVFSVDEHSPAP